MNSASADAPFDRVVRETVLHTVVATMQNRFYDPNFNGKDWQALAAVRTGEVLASQNPDAFAESVQALLKQLDVHPTDFFHETAAKVPFHRVARATLFPYQGGWMLQDVHADGAADRAGLVPGDIVTALDGVPAHQNQQVNVRPGGMHLSVVKRQGGRAELDLCLQTGTERAATRYVSAERLPGSMGLLRIAQFPGLVGIDVAHAIDRAVGELSDCDRLIVDLRGNPGGGSANLRLMSYLTPDKLPVGYSLTRPRAQAGYKREELAQFRAIPSTKLALIWLALRFKWVDKSIVVVTEGEVGGPARAK